MGFCLHDSLLKYFFVTKSLVFLCTRRAPPVWFGSFLKQNKLWDDIMTKHRLENQGAEILYTRGSQIL